MGGGGGEKVGARLAGEKGGGGDSVIVSRGATEEGGVGGHTSSRSWI